MQFKFKKKLGQGAKGKVYLATYVVNPKTGKKIDSAVKQVPAWLMDLKEIELQSQLSKLPKCNRYVACYYDMKQDPKTKDYFIIMEYVQGQELWDLVRLRASSWTPAEMLSMFRQMAKGLKFIHSRGIVHGDIKMENLMATTTHGTLIKYIDFGYGCSEETCKSSGVWHGTSYLKPPEAHRDHEPPKNLKTLQKADVWALGCLMAEMVLSRARDVVTRVDSVHMDGASVMGKSNWKASRYLPATQDQTMLQIYEVIDGLMAVNPAKRSTAAQAARKLSAL
jgi:serine/threonine protein kinase